MMVMPTRHETGRDATAQTRPANAMNAGRDGDEPDGGGMRPERPGGQTVLERAPKTKKPQLYRVLLHNDDYTSMEFVVWVLQVVFHKSASEATQLMLAIHTTGKGIGGIYTRDIAETKAQQSMDLAEEHQMPLQVTTEPDE